MKTQRFPQEALHDILSKLTEHSSKYKIDGVSLHFDGDEYRLAFKGEGELVEQALDQEDVTSTQPIVAPTSMRCSACDMWNAHAPDCPLITSA